MLRKVDQKGNPHQFSFIKKVPLNDSHPDLEVNFLEYWGINKKEKTTYHNTWVTDLSITQENVYEIMQGDGNKNLSTVFAILMMLAFLIDQSEQICCGLFQGALKELFSTKRYLWECIRSFFRTYIFVSWEALYRAIMAEGSREVPILGSS